MADASFLKTVMATNVVNLCYVWIETEMNLFSPLDRCSTLVVVTDLLFLGVFVLFFLFPLLDPVIFSYVTETKTSQECLFIEQYLVHFLMLFGCVNIFTAPPKVDKRRAASMRCTKKKKKTDKGLCALVYMQCIPPMAICYLIVAVSKSMWLKQ